MAMDKVIKRLPMMICGFILSFINIIPNMLPNKGTRQLDSEQKLAPAFLISVTYRTYTRPEHKLPNITAEMNYIKKPRKQIPM